jgi:hypothetical protein
MQNKIFGGRTLGALASAAVAALLAQGALADDGAKAAGKGAAAGGSCVHSCNGYAACKGNGNNSCKGKNDCANTGLVPKACSSQKTPEDCKKVLDDKKNTMCSWFTK